MFQSFEEIILKDVRRTANCLADPAHFKNVQTVLTCFARRNPEIGYLQGFNFIVDFFLSQGFAPEEAFWILVYIVEDLLHKQFYTSFFPIFADIKFFKCMLYHLNYKIFKHVVDRKLDLFFILHKWFLLHFMEIPNKALTSWVLDFFFVEHEICTLKTTLVMFTSNPKEILKQGNIEELKQYFDGVIESFSDEAQFKGLFKKFFLSKELFEYARELLIKKEEGGSFYAGIVRFCCIKIEGAGCNGFFG